MKNKLLLDLFYDSNLDSGVKYFYIEDYEKIPDEVFISFIKIFQSKRSSNEIDNSILYLVLSILNNKTAFRFIDLLYSTTKNKEYLYLFFDIIYSRKVTLNEFLEIKHSFKNHNHSLLLNLDSNSTEDEDLLFSHIIKDLEYRLQKTKKITYIITPEIITKNEKYLQRIIKLNSVINDYKANANFKIVYNPTNKYGNSINSRNKDFYKYKFKNSDDLDNIFEYLKSNNNIIFNKKSKNYTNVNIDFIDNLERYKTKLFRYDSYKEVLYNNINLKNWFENSVIPFDGVKPKNIVANYVNNYLFEFYIKNISKDVVGIDLKSINKTFNIYSTFNNYEQEFEIMYSLFGKDLKDKLINKSLNIRLKYSDLSRIESDILYNAINNTVYFELFNYIYLNDITYLSEFILKLCDKFDENKAIEVFNMLSLAKLTSHRFLDCLMELSINKKFTYSNEFLLNLLNLFLKKGKLNLDDLTLRNYKICPPEYEQFWDIFKNYGFKLLRNN